MLLALTATRHSGALLVTLDRHFDALRKHIGFQVEILADPATG